jgi:hypothetical protein
VGLGCVTQDVDDDELGLGGLVVNGLFGGFEGGEERGVGFGELLGERHGGGGAERAGGRGKGEAGEQERRGGEGEECPHGFAQAKSQAKNLKIHGLKPAGVSVWSYKTKKGTRWAFEARYKTDTEVIKKQRRGFPSKPTCISAATQGVSFPQTISDPKKSVCFSDLIGAYISGLEGKVAETSRANYFHLLTLYPDKTSYQLLCEQILRSTQNQLSWSLNSTSAL